MIRSLGRFDHKIVIEVDLAKKIEESVESLPEKRRQIFKMSREEGLKYREIAEKLQLSVKTVEKQMGLAFKHLRNKLKNYNTFLFFISAYSNLFRINNPELKSTFL